MTKTKMKPEKEIREKLEYLKKLKYQLKTELAQFALEALIKNYEWVLGEEK